jgi:hypothetical protein
MTWRREWDSNPRRLAPQRFSRPPPSTTRPSLPLGVSLGLLVTRSPFPRPAAGSRSVVGAGERAGRRNGGRRMSIEPRVNARHTLQLKAPHVQYRSRTAERCWSGRSGLPAKQLSGVYLDRGFESRPLRQRKPPTPGAVIFLIGRPDRTPGPRAVPSALVEPASTVRAHGHGDRSSGTE